MPVASLFGSLALVNIDFEPLLVPLEMAEESHGIPFARLLIATVASRTFAKVDPF